MPTKVFKSTQLTASNEAKVEQPDICDFCPFLLVLTTRYSNIKQIDKLFLCILIMKGREISRYKTSDGPLVIYENHRYRWFNFDNHMIQTIICKKKPWLPMLKYIPALLCTIENKSENALLLGTGGGGAIHYANKYLPKLNVDCVDVNETIIMVAKKYFHICNPIIHQSADDYINTCAPYAHILLDVFGSHETPAGLLNQDFLDMCQQKTRLTFSCNLINDHHQKTLALIERIKHAFDNRTLCLQHRRTNNLVIHGFKSKNYLEAIAKLHQRGLISRPTWSAPIGATSIIKFP